MGDGLGSWLSGELAVGVWVDGESCGARLAKEKAVLRELGLGVVSSGNAR